jgi:hypothetical protein
MPHHRDHSHTDPPRCLEVEPGQTEKLRILLAHWAKHNEAHAQTYREWGQRANDLRLEGVAERLNEAIELTLGVKRTLEAALAAMGSTTATVQAQAGTTGPSSETK